MSDLSDRLRAEARALPSGADPGLAARVLARLPATIPAGRAPLRFPLPLAIAAGLLLAVGAAWAMLAQPAPPPPAPVAVVPAPVMPPAPPTLSDLLQGAQAALPVTGELQALRADLAAVAATVRGAVPF